MFTMFDLQDGLSGGFGSHRAVRTGQEPMYAARPENEPPSHTSLFADIGNMLVTNGLDPSPAHYELLYRYFTAGDALLVAAVNDAIRQHGVLTAAMAATIAAQRRTELSATELGRMADEAQRRLGSLASIVDRSGQDARDYGDALARNVDALESGPRSEALVALMSLTRSMIDKTRSAREELQRTAGEISVLRENLAEARKTAETDALTGLPNRRALDIKMRMAFEAAREQGKPLSIAICDIDAFKAINDLHGHQLGDKVIRFIAGSLSRHASDRLYVARYGGEEFVMLFEDMSVQAAADLIDGIRNEIASREFKVAETGRPIGRLTFSAGVAAMDGRKGPAATLKSADTALYRAKNEGRNRVCIAE
ncbi:GGDEF domain-containing protein [Sphingomonas sp. KC8]|uniref:GGDEF domain-containing protein n=1 Tax=Sphingomonas sp. KC8 TaxID=1030157 RepID=UPI0002489BCE|nr:GGDEF domain-containing protein [Sphingomonas sp. KC8]